MSQTEQIKYLIDAEDKATAKINAATAVVEKNVKQVKELGGQAKKSSEVVSVLASSFGGTQFGAFAAQIGNITDKTAQFSEVSKLGGAGALAFKAGLIGAVAVISTQVGSAIGNAIFQTEKWNAELQATIATMDKLSSTAIGNMGKAFERERERIGLLIDPAEQEQANAELLASVQANLQGVGGQVEAYKAKIAEMDTVVGRTFNQAQIDLEKAGLKDAEARLAALQKQRDTLNEQNSEYAKMFEQMKAQKASADFTKDLEAQVEHAKALTNATSEQARRMVEINAIAAKSGVGKDQEKIKALLLEKDEQERIAKQRIEAEKAVGNIRQKFTEAWERANQKIIDDQKQSLETQKSTIGTLQSQAFEIARGKEASEAMKLEQQGFDSATANRLAQMQAALGKTGESAGSVNLLTAKDDRFSTGEKEREEARQRNEIEKRTLAQAEAQRKLAESMLAELKAIAAKKETQLAVLGT